MNTDQAIARTCKMWLRLGNQLAKGAPDLVERGYHLQAIQWAICAEACFWQATGEADSFNLKDAIQQSSALAKNAQ